MIGVLQFDIEYHEESEMGKIAAPIKYFRKLKLLLLSAEKTVVTIDAKMAYRDKEDKDDDWKYYASSREERILECTMKEVGCFDFL